ncbi:hypothetical protein M413DRAFT_14860 [Hebeloma cylindrosporum]|uniref:Uncharacterized protein n=1 Tax=Hebeloma cylindrosporum TaxID=76867 RepID=A0A0C2XA32_HEBCY|nr:hypothetical protein M413DRAFT_14860 [Hebeloma cylindrosporum h7]
MAQYIYKDLCFYYPLGTISHLSDCVEFRNASGHYIFPCFTPEGEPIQFEIVTCDDTGADDFRGNPSASGYSQGIEAGSDAPQNQNHHFNGFSDPEQPQHPYANDAGPVFRHSSGGATFYSAPRLFVGGQIVTPEQAQAMLPGVTFNNCFVVTHTHTIIRRGRGDGPQGGGQHT